MDKYKEIYDEALALLEKTNKEFTDVTQDEKDTLNCLLTGFINNVNSILIKNIKNATNQSSKPQETGTGNK
jgi:hypothetical protein